jgi:hypothetical protein
MLDRTPITAEPITAEMACLITSGTSEQQFLAAVARRFTELTRTEFVAALQDAVADTERRARAKSLTSGLANAN